MERTRPTKPLCATLVALTAACFVARSQSYTEYKFTFSGTAYATNATGRMVGTPITDQTLLQDRARLGGITNLGTISIVYHLNGNPLGDTIDVVSNANGQVLATELGLYFGSDASLGRTAITNAAQTQQKRIDYIYTSGDSTYTFNNDDSVGLSITSKNLLVTNGNTNLTVCGTMSWGVEPQGTNGPILCIGNFATADAVF